MKASDKIQLLLKGVKLSEIKELEEQEKKENEENKEKEREVLKKNEEKYKKDDEKNENKEDKKDSEIEDLKKNFTELKELIEKWQEKNISDVNTEDEEKTTVDKVEDIANRLFK